MVRATLRACLSLLSKELCSVVDALLLGSLVHTCANTSFQSLWLDGILNLHFYLFDKLVN